VFEIGTDYFLRGDKYSFIDRPTSLKSLGLLPYKNRAISIDEFDAQMKAGYETRMKMLAEPDPVLMQEQTYHL
jgi:hypothetical protein